MRRIAAVAGVVCRELYRRKDFYVLFVLIAVVTVSLASVRFFHDEKIIRFVKESCLLLIWASAIFIAIATTARQIPSEREQRTIFPLLAKPISRGEFVLGKFAGCWAACGLALVIFYFFFLVISASRESDWRVIHYFQALWLHWFLLGIVIAYTLLGSMVFAAPSSNGTICFILTAGILLVGRHLEKIANTLTQPGQTIVNLLYFFLPHLEFFDVRDLIIHNVELVPWMACLLATLYGAVYIAFFLVLAWMVFKRQRFQ